MKDDVHIISGFDHDSGNNNTPFVVDFATAKVLNRSGSTCDAYECIIQRRRVFVKRLKARYRDNPLYRAAFSKEYDLGVSLSHPSLPRYVGFGDDYMAMDFIEGDTLADLMKRGDKRLDDKRFVCRLLKELIDVVEYLHLRNIVHCDIKADNIMVSPYHDRPITLIDLDKAYTSWLNDTSGNPEKYGCDECADGEIDFRGIGLIAERLGHRRVAATARRKEVDAATIREALQQRGLLSRWWVWLMAGCIAVVIVAALFDGNQRPPVGEQPELAPTSVAPAATVIPVDTVAAPVATISHEKPEPAPMEPQAPRPEELPSVDEIVRRHYSDLSRRHEFLRVLAADTASSALKLQTVATSYVAEQEEAQANIISDIMDRYKLNNPLEATSILSTSKEWGRFMEQDAEINRLYFREIERRGDVNRQSRRPSDRPVSQPDTTQDAGLHVQHR